MGGFIGAGDAGVVHDNIDPAEHCGDLGHDLLDLPFDGDVASPVRRPLLAARQFAGERGAVFIKDIEQRDLGALFGHSSADRLSDPQRCPRYDGHLLSKSRHDVLPSS